MRHAQWEHNQAALALLLGPETDAALRIQATRRLMRQGAGILPLVLTTLNHYPEITTPPWPWWPPQYEHCSRLLLHLSHEAHLCLEALLESPAIVPPAGPVLWISVIEATALLPQHDYETLLCQGLTTPWSTVRYAAAMALTTRAQRTLLDTATLDALRGHLEEPESFPVRLTAACALLNCGDDTGLAVLQTLLAPELSLEVRRGAAFILSTPPAIPLSLAQRERVTTTLMGALHDHDTELALHAAHALSLHALPSILPALSEILRVGDPQVQIATLSLLEELVRRKNMRLLLRQQAFPTRILPLCASANPELRRQASYTLAACGGEYATAVLGTMVLNKNHPAHIEAIESLRILHGVLRSPLRGNVVRWLLRLLVSPQEEETQVAALASLTHLLWMTRAKKQHRAWHDICQALLQESSALRLIYAPNALLRQRVIELLTMLDEYLDYIDNLQPALEHLLLEDTDSGVRACVAYACQQIAARWAIPMLLRALLDPDENVAHTALYALGRIATIDDTIVVYTFTELTFQYEAHTPDERSLALAATRQLKKWRIAEQSRKDVGFHSVK